jgi:hypothetical protein
VQKAILDAVIKLRKKVANESVADRRQLQQTHRYCTVQHSMQRIDPAVTGAYLRAETQVAALKPGAGLAMPDLPASQPESAPAAESITTAEPS